MASPGTLISAAGHVGLLAWLLSGWGLTSDPLPFEISEVSIVTGEEFEDLVAATTPNPDTAEPVAPTVPEEGETPAAPELQSSTDAVDPPSQVTTPDQEAPPPEAPEDDTPPVSVDDTPPEVALLAPQETPEIAGPITDALPQADQAPRIVPDPIEAPETDRDVSPLPIQPVSPQAPVETETEPVPEETASAPDETSQIVTEPEEPSGAIATSLRPTTRPNRPAPQPEVETETAAAETDDVQAALEAALASNEPAVPQGPPMTGSERDAFRIAVNRCWNVDPGSIAATVTLTVGFSLTEQGRVDGNVRQVSASGGDASAQRTAFEAARRAILRCQGQGGYTLPAEKYGQWKDVEITFDPSGMRLR